MEKTMQLSDGEKLILYMLAEISERVGVKNGISPDLIREAIGGGHLWALEWELPSVFSEEISNDVVKETVDYLDMWSFIELSYEALEQEQRAELAERVEHFGTAPRFRGFDGNNETAHTSVARMLIKHMGRFQGFADRELNSHMPSVDTYRRMFRAFEPIRPVLADRHLNVDELAAILSERVHPSNR